MHGSIITRLCSQRLNVGAVCTIPVRKPLTVYHGISIRVFQRWFPFSAMDTMLMSCLILFLLPCLINFNEKKGAAASLHWEVRYLQHGCGIHCHVFWREVCPPGTLVVMPARLAGIFEPHDSWVWPCIDMGVNGLWISWHKPERAITYYWVWWMQGKPSKMT